MPVEFMTHNISSVGLDNYIHLMHDSYPFSIRLNLKPEHYGDLIKKAKDKHTWIVYNLSPIENTIVVTDKSTFLFYINKVSGILRSSSVDVAKDVLEVIGDYLLNPNDSELISVQCYYSTPHGIDSAYISVNRKDFIAPYSELYPDIDIDILLTRYLSSPDKVLILYGSPGTGKTTLLKHIMVQSNTAIAYCKDDKCLEDDSFWYSIIQEQKGLLILDDFDSPLGGSSGNRSDIVSKLIAFSDGVLLNKTKIIITTNQTKAAIDEALIRPGRCFDYIELTQLKRDYALDFWINVLKRTEEEFNNAFTSPQISQAALMSAYRSIISTGLVRDYMKTGDRKYTAASRKIKSGF